MGKYLLKRWISEKNLWVYFIPLLLVFLNFVLKVVFLDNAAISNDEPFSIYHAQMDVPSIIYQLSLGNNPPLFEILLHYWIKLFGISAFSVRFLPMVFSVLTVLVIYKIGYRFFNKIVALTASLLFTFSSVQYIFVHQARVYTLFVLLSCLSIYAFLYLIENTDKKRAIFYLFFWNILLIYSHYFGLWMPVIETIACITLKPLREKILKPFIIAISAVTIAYLPFIAVFFGRFSESASKGTWVQPVDVSAAFIMFSRFFNSPFVSILFLFILISACILLFIRKELININIQLVTIWFILPFIVMFILSLRYMPHSIPVFLERYLLFTTPALYLLAANALWYCTRSLKRNIIFIVLAIFIFIIGCHPRSAEILSANEEAELVRNYKTPETVVYFAPEYYMLNFIYHYDKAIFAHYNTSDVLATISRDLAKQKIFALYNYTTMDTSLVYTSSRFICIDADKQWGSAGNESLRQTVSAHFNKETKITMQSSGHVVFIYDK